MINSDGSGMKALAHDQENKGCVWHERPAGGTCRGVPTWSPDAVFVMKSDGSNAHRLTPWALRAGQPDWSPNGRRILFYSNWGGPSTVSANLYTVGLNGTGLRQLTHARGGREQHLGATFSPDGKWIAFSRTKNGGNADVFVMRANGTHVRNVTRSAIWDSGVDWGPRG